MAMLFKIFVRAAAILMLSAAASQAQTAQKPADSDSTDIKVLEERVKKNEEKTQGNLEAIRNEIEYRDSSRKDEINDKTKELEKRIDLYFWGGSIVLGFIVFLLTFLGAKTVANWIKDKIDEKVNEITERELENTWGNTFQKFAEQKTAEYESSLSERLNKIEKEREEYLRLKNELLEMKDTIAMKEPSSKEQAEKYEEFEEKLQSIKREEQYSSIDLVFLGNSEYLKGNYKEAFEYFNQAIDINPKEPIAYNNRGLTYCKLKEHKKAIDDYKKAIDLNLGYIDAYENTAELLIIMGKYDLAIGKIDEAMTKSILAGEKAVLLYLKCIAQKLLRKDTIEAETELEEILKEDIAPKWLFDEMEEWMKATDIPEDTKSFIEEKTEMLKKKME